MVGDLDAVAIKILSVHAALDGFSRMTILIDNRVLTHRQIMRAIELHGTRVAPLVKTKLSPIPASSPV